MANESQIGVYLALMLALPNGSLDLGLQVRRGFSPMRRATGRSMSRDKTTLIPQVGLDPTTATWLVESWLSSANGFTNSGGPTSFTWVKYMIGESNARGDNPELKSDTKLGRGRREKRGKRVKNCLFCKSMASTSKAQRSRPAYWASVLSATR